MALSACAGGGRRIVVYFCTSNSNKLREVQRLMEVPELQGESPQAIAREKCKTALRLFKQTKGESNAHTTEDAVEFVLTEDTALCFEALGGLPGPYVKWFLKGLGPAGLPKLLAGFENKAAYAMTNLCLANDEDELFLFEGRCDGSIVEPRGSQVFGWDCVFEESKSKKTFGEMTSEEKNKVSHRAKAMKQLRTYLQELVQQAKSP